MKKIFLLSCLLATVFFSVQISAQITQTPPGSACIGDPLMFHTPVDAVTYQWDFSNTGPVNIVQPMMPTVPLNTLGTFSVPAFSCFLQDHTTGRYFLFVTEYVTGHLIRVEYNPTGFTPIAGSRVDLGDFGAPGVLAEAIDIVFESGTWYGIMVNDNRLIQLNFGSALHNIPASTVTTVPAFAWPHQATLFKDGPNWYAFVANRSGNITRINFGANPYTVYTTTSIPNVGGVSNPCNFTMYFEAPNWYMLVPSLISAQVTRYDFGPSRLNPAPTGTLLPQSQKVLTLPRQIFALNDCNGHVLAYTFNEGGNLIRLDFGTSITTMPVYSVMGPTGTFSIGSGTPAAYDNKFCYIIPNFSTGQFRVFDPFLNLSPTSPLHYHDQNQSWVTPSAGSYDISLLYDMGRPTGPSVDCHNVIVEKCQRPCADSTSITTTSTTDASGNCIFTSTAHVSTSNVILGYKWSGVGPAVIHHSSLNTDSYTYTVPPGGSGIINCTVYIVDTSFTDTSRGPCCEVTISDTVECNPPCCFDTAATGLNSIGMSTSAGCLFNVSAYYGLRDPRCQFIGYQWTTSAFSTGIIATSAFSIPVPYSTTGYATVTFYAITPQGDTCTVTKTVWLPCDGEPGQGCCFDTTNTFLTVMGTSTPNGDCEFIVNAFYAFLPQNCQFLGYQWITSWLSTGIVGTSTMTVPVPSGTSGYATVTFYALNAQGDTCTFTRTVNFRCPDDVNTDCCFDTTNTYLSVLGMSLAGGGCMFNVTAHYILADPKCIFIGYQWLTSSFSTLIVATSSMGVPVPAGGTGYATVIFYALNAQGDTCKFTRTITFTCDQRPHMMPPPPGARPDEDKSSNTSSEIMIFPNPTDNIVKITAKNIDIKTVEVIDVNGKKVRQYSYDHIRATSVSLNPLPPGSYLFKVNESTSKVIIKK